MENLVTRLSNRIMSAGYLVKLGLKGIRVVSKAGMGLCIILDWALI